MSSYIVNETTINRIVSYLGCITRPYGNAILRALEQAHDRPAGAFEHSVVVNFNSADGRLKFRVANANISLGGLNVFMSEQFADLVNIAASVITSLGECFP